MIGTGIALGAKAPDFSLRDQYGQDVALSDFRGRKRVLLVFYPFAFSGVCTSEMDVLRRRSADFITFDTELLAVSCDPVFSLRAFSDREGIHFQLLSDFWPHGEVSAAYGVFDQASGVPFRSSVVIDERGFVAWQCHVETGQMRDFDAHLGPLHGLAQEENASG